MREVVLHMSESEFISEVEDVLRPVDPGAKVIPFSGAVATRATYVKAFSLGIVSSVEKREAVYDALFEYAKPHKNVMDYTGWALSTDDKTFQTVIHNITARLNNTKKGC